MRVKYVPLAIILLLIFALGPNWLSYHQRAKYDPYTDRKHLPTTTVRTNTLANYKHQGPHCAVSSNDLYHPQNLPCQTKDTLLTAMSSGGRLGRNAPYTARDCDMAWLTTAQICEVLGRFEKVVLVGDSMLRHVMGALNIFLREDLGYGAVTDWNFGDQEKQDCFCLNQFNVKTCSVQGIYKTADVREHDPGSLICPKIFPAWSTDLLVEQINRYPIPPLEASRLRQVIKSHTPRARRAFILGQGLWNDLDIKDSTKWLHSILQMIHPTKFSNIARNSKPNVAELDPTPDHEPPILLITPNAAGPLKENRWIVSQGNKALMLFEEAMEREAHTLGIDHLGTWNMSIQSTLYDGVHMDMRGNLLKAMMVVNWLSMLDD